MPQRGLPRVFENYVPCGACTALVHRSQLQGLTPEETHHSQKELVSLIAQRSTCGKDASSSPPQQELAIRS